MIKDLRSGKPVDSQRLAKIGAPTPLALPGLNGRTRNGIVTCKTNPANGLPDFLRSNLINFRGNPHGNWYSSDLHQNGGMYNVQPGTRGNRSYHTLNANGDWLCYYQLGAERKVTRYAIVTENGYTPNSWRLEGSNDGELWTTLDTKSATWTWDSGRQNYQFDIPVENQDYYQFWRFIVDTMSATSVRIWELFLWENDESTDEYVHIYATPEDPLVLSFADGFSGSDPINHIVTLTEERLVDMAGVWRGLGFWGFDKFSVNWGIITADYDPVTGVVSFGLKQEDIIGDGATRAERFDVKQYYMSSVMNGFYSPERFFDGNFSSYATMRYYSNNYIGPVGLKRIDGQSIAFSGYCVTIINSDSYSDNNYCSQRLIWPSVNKGLSGENYNPLETDFFSTNNYLRYGSLRVSYETTYSGWENTGHRSFGALMGNWFLSPVLFCDINRMRYYNSGDGRVYQFRPFYDRAQSLFYNIFDGKMYWRDINSGAGDTHCRWVKLGTAGINGATTHKLDYTRYEGKYKPDVTYITYDTLEKSTFVNPYAESESTIPSFRGETFLGRGT